MYSHIISHLNKNNLSLLPVDVANTLLVNHVKSVCVGFVNSFILSSIYFNKLVSEPAGLLNYGEKDVCFERQN